MDNDITAFPFDSQVESYETDGTPIYDRATDSNGFRDLLMTYFNEGVFAKPSNGLQVIENGTLGALVKKGSCMVGGVTVQLKNDKTITFDSASSSPRIDRVVMRVDDTLSVRAASINILKGAPSSNPQPQTRTYTNTIKELVLAEVYISANATTITNYNITDTRSNDSICGIVSGAFNELDMNSLMEQNTAKFNEWFDSIKDKLDGDTAGNLQNQIDEISSTVLSIQNSINSIPLLIYPVGSIYETMDSTFNPNDAWGGTWERTSEGRFPVGRKSSDSDFAKVGQTGGEKKHTLIESEMPLHDHHPSSTARVQLLNPGSGGSYVFANLTDIGNTNWGYRTSKAGGNQAHNNLPPYEVHIFWRRLA